ncbi:MAG: GNAT family N-acetyltransferase [Acidimicrobiia bacterium]
MFDISMTEAPARADLDAVERAVLEFNMERTGFRDDRVLGCVLRDPDGALIAGLSGFTWGGYGMIEWLFVRDDQRGSGLGTRLVRAAEEEAVRRGCVVMRVNTHTFQAPDFYRRLGYDDIGEAVDTPVGHGEVFYAKRLDRSS